MSTPSVDAYFPEHALVVELDGWGSHRTRERVLADRRQDLTILIATGIPTVRLSAEDVGDQAIGRLGALLAARAGCGSIATPSRATARITP